MSCGINALLCSVSQWFYVHTPQCENFSLALSIIYLTLPSPTGFLAFTFCNYSGHLSLLAERKATITRCDLSPRFFCIDATLLCEFESDKI